MLTGLNEPDLVYKGPSNASHATFSWDVGFTWTAQGSAVAKAACMLRQHAYLILVGTGIDECAVHFQGLTLSLLYFMEVT